MSKTAFIGLLLCLSLTANGLLLVRLFFSSDTSTIAASQSPDSQFLSPRIYTSNQNDYLINFVELRSELRDYVNSAENPIGLYFEYLPTGNSIGVNEKESFLLASLLKVPVVMGIYRQVANGELNMDQKVRIEEKDIDTGFGDLGEKGVGTSLTLREAIELTLTKSDNTAKNLLQKQLGEGDLENVYNSLDIPIDEASDGPVVTPKNYSSVLRSLYLSSFLNKEHSREILEILTRTVFTDKLPAGIDDDIKVAHKIGVFTAEETGSEPIYSDCGIVYVPKRPYILCIMTKSDESTAQNNIESISKMVFDYVSQANSTPTKP